MYLNIALLAGLILVYAAVAGRLEKTSISGAMVFTGFGFLFGPSVLGLLDLQVSGETIRLLAEMTLAIVLFVDAAHADKDVVKSSFRIVLRLLAISLPLTILAGIGLGLFVFDGLALVEIALLATMLAPTDAALGKPVVSNKSVPVAIRETLNFESGLNDGICVPILLFFLILAKGGAEHGSEISLMTLFLEEVGIGTVVGVATVLVVALIFRYTVPRGWVTETWSRIIIASTAVVCFAAAQSLGGSGLIACFVGGLVIGSSARDHKTELIHAGEVFGEAFSLLTWVIFGAAIVGLILTRLTWETVLYSVLSLTALRMVPVFLSLTGSGLKADDKLFIGWFGPRGLASIVFAVMVANENLPGGETIGVTVAFTVLLSVIAHGVTASPLANAYAARKKASSQ